MNLQDSIQTSVPETINKSSIDEMFDFIMHKIINDTFVIKALQEKERKVRIEITNNAMVQYLKTELKKPRKNWTFDSVSWLYFCSDQTMSIWIIGDEKTLKSILQLQILKPQYRAYSFTESELKTIASGDPIGAIDCALWMAKDNLGLAPERAPYVPRTKEDYMAEGLEPMKIFPIDYIDTPEWRKWETKRKQEQRFGSGKIIHSVRTDVDYITHTVQIHPKKTRRWKSVFEKLQSVNHEIFDIISRGNVRYPVNLSNLTHEELNEIWNMHSIYRDCWSSYDWEWEERLSESFFKKYLKNEHRFFILYSHRNKKPEVLKEYKKIIGFLRATPFESSTDIHAEYLWACSIKDGYSGIGLMQSLVQDYFNHPATIANEVYLHVLADSPEKKFWEYIWFEEIKWKEIISDYGTMGRKRTSLLMCITREKYTEIQKNRKEKKWGWWFKKAIHHLAPSFSRALWISP